MRLSILFSISLIIFLAFNSCEKEEDQKDPNKDFIEYDKGNGIIGSGGGSVTVSDPSSDLNSAYVKIPEGALNSEENIKIASPPDDVKLPTDSSAQIVQLEPEGLKFKKPVEIGIPYSSMDKDKIKVIYYNRDSSQIYEIPTQKIDNNKKVISALIDHFSYYSVSDDNIVMQTELLDVDKKLGVKFFIKGNYSNTGIKWVPCRILHGLSTGEQNAWMSLLEEDNTVWSVFKIMLYRDRFIGNEYLGYKSVYVKREMNFYHTRFIAEIFDENSVPSEPLFTSGNLDNEDINDNKKAIGNWFSGRPFVAVFDHVNIEDDEEYFVEIKWALARENSGFNPYNYTPIYKFNFKDDKKKIGEMANYTNDIDENGVDDDYQVWLGTSPPEANFEADKTSITEGETVQFTDQSSGNPTSWDWEFGDGSSSTSQNPSHTYTTAGNYTVSLTATNEYGSDEKIINDYITVNEPSTNKPDLIIEEITMSPTNPAINENITFTVVVKNIGQNDSESCKISIAAGGESDPPEYNIPGLNTGETHTITRTESHSIAQNYRTTAEADIYDAVDEENENNNSKYINYTVTDGDIETGTFTDSRDGQTYNWVKIGDQVWMAENLAYLPSVNRVEDGSEDNSSRKYYYVYGYDGTSVSEAKATENYDTYGVLYNWNAVMAGASSSSSNPSGVQGVCPDGWHVPSDEEWKELEMELGMSQSEADDYGYRGTNEGSKLAGNASLWGDGELENNSAFGTSGFSALPGGYRSSYGSFDYIGRYGHWRSSTVVNSSSALARGLGELNSDVARDWPYKERGSSVRCVRDD